jgi:predicted dehydrogenase
VDVPPYYDTFAEFQLSYRYGDIYSPRIEDYEPLKKLSEHFLDCIRDGKNPHTDGQNGLRVVSILEAACKSLKHSGKAIAVQTAKEIGKNGQKNGNGPTVTNGGR